ncbi:glycogen debranching protein GlgX [Litorihabitans aurantiacus]|uniref:Glycogen operon protein GlgX homolog n=1 Tax=Litorihabitans aurantiacus TaxID=1930061 RepID=A0AA37XD26_9MICO|nr:glycogen debranching protein GlgX [Litorihabitans aurantiacus]GMA30720.1 glycogen operon protein GlgX homolog [Litorihabitans aurantiacus]
MTETIDHASAADPAGPGAPAPAPPAERGARSLARLGVHVVGDGVDVVVAASQADAVDLVLLRATEGEPDGERRVGLLRARHGLWHAHVPDVAPGTRYGLRVHGAWDPASGQMHNPAKLLLDPYARGVEGEIAYVPEIFGHVVADARETHTGLEVRDDRDSAPFVPHGVVLAPSDPAETARRQAARPRTPWSRTVVYEAHVRGFTLLHPDVPEELRGTYAGLAHPAVVAHLRGLGVTAIELLPIHAFVTEHAIAARGLPNYWGYSTLGYLAPEPSYATAAAREAGADAVVAEVRAMVDALHEAGIEVILDVVYNHTCEGGLDGPLLSLRGLDNTGYHLHDGGSPARYADVTGTGNSLDFRRQRVVQLTLDSLRYWAGEVGVDGFRFDLAVTLGRRAGEFDPDHPFLVALASDPVLADVKLIAEPWDVGPSGWRTGQFAPPMHEWNDRFRDSVRRFWLADARALAHGQSGTPHDMRDLATRLAGSADMFHHLDRGPAASINYVTAHDGFTLADLVTYDHKHNEANLEDNRDGSDNNLSWNHGVEGRVPAGAPGSEVRPVRRRSMRNVLGTLLASAGTPMITAGDEFARTQRGNNNAYCQDSDISWVDWDLAPWQRELKETTSHLLALRREHPALRPARFAYGRGRSSDPFIDLAWFAADGGEVDGDAWHDPYRRVLQMRRSGGAALHPRSADGVAAASPSGAASSPRDLLVVINGSLNEVEVALAPSRTDGWELVWDSVWDTPGEVAEAAAAGLVEVDGGARVPLEALSIRYYLSR